jgi:glutaredoxin 3
MTLVDELIKSNKVVIFSKTYCSYSAMAKYQFDKIDCKYSAIELDKMSPSMANEVAEMLFEKTSISTVPQVFVNGKFIGGGSNVRKLNENGHLKKIINTPP